MNNNYQLKKEKYLKILKNKEQIMRNTKLIPTNGLWYKIKKFFRSLFFKEKSYNIDENNIAEKEQENNNFTHIDNLKEEFKKENKKKVLAEKLLYGELGTIELNDDEVNEMTEYFNKDIQNIDNELLRIKKHILAMRQELNQ